MVSVENMHWFMLTGHIAENTHLPATQSTCLLVMSNFKTIIFFFYLYGIDYVVFAHNLDIKLILSGHAQMRIKDQ